MKFLKKVIILVRRNPMLSAITLVGFLLRIIGTSPGYYMHGYEVIYGDAVSMILNKTIGLSFTNLAYPPLVFWIMATAFLFFFIPLSLIVYFITNFSDIVSGQINFFANFNEILTREILGTRYWQNAMYWGRYITAIFGSTSIIIIYKVVMEFFSKKTMALIAAFMLAVNYRLVINSHMGFFDIYNVFFLLLTLLALGKLLKKPTTRFYIIAAVCSILTFLVKYQPSAFIAFGITHLIITSKTSKRNFRLFVKNLFSKPALIAGGVALIILLIAHVDYFVRIKEVIAYSPWVWTANEFHKYQLYLFPLSYVYHVGLGPALTLISLGGIIIGLFIKKYREQTFILVSPILISFYLFAYFSSGGYYTYNLLIPISIMLIFAALFFEQARMWLVRNSVIKVSRLLAATLLVLVLAFVLKEQIYNSILSTYILAQPSYRIATENWLNENLKGPAVLATYTSNPRTQKEDIEIVDLPNSPEVIGYREFLQEKYNYALIDFFKIQEKNFWWMLSPPRMPTQFWEKPDDLLSQNYLALATRELLWNNTIKDFMLPWQASGYNYAVTKIETPPDFNMTTLIKRFGFDSKDDWTSLFFLEKDKDKLLWSEEGRINKGSIVIRKGKEAGNNKWLTIPGAVRWESPTLRAKPGFGYKVTGWIKNSEYVDKKLRNGFLRLDFYKNDDGHEITSRPIISFVSERPYGDSQWRRVEVQGTAPVGTNFVKISFQADDPTETLAVDEVEVYETQTELKGLDTHHFTIPDYDFFRPSDSSFT